MKLSRVTDVSLRALMYLGAHEDRAVPVIEMAQRLAVSQDHLLDGFRTLADMDLVRREPGRRGGFRLGPACARIRLGRVVRALEPSMDMRECAMPVPTCPLSGACGLAGTLERARDAFMAELDQRTVWDLVVETRSNLVQLTTDG